MINCIIICLFVCLFPNIYATQENEVVSLATKYQNKLIKIVSCETQEFSEKDLQRIIIGFREKLEIKFNINGRRFNRELSKLFHIDILAPGGNFDEMESVFLALLRNRNIYKKKIFLYELLKFGFLSKVESDFIDCNELYFQIKNTIKGMLVDFIRDREDITCFLDLFDLSKRSKFSFIDEGFDTWFKEIWTDLAVELIDVFEVGAFEFFFTIVRVAIDSDVISMKFDAYGSVEINNRVFNYLLKKLYNHNKYLSYYINDKNKVKAIVNSKMIYRKCLGKGKKFKAFRYLQLLKMRNIYFRFLGYNFITPAVERGRRGDIYIFFSYILSGELYLQEVSKFGGLAEILLVADPGSCMLKKAILLKNSILLSLFLYVLEGEVDYHDALDNNLFHLIFMFSESDKSEFEDIDSTCLYLIRLLKYSSRLNPKYIKSSVKDLNTDSYTPIDLAAKEGMFFCYKELLSYAL
jgi:hypothetical protein